MSKEVKYPKINTLWQRQQEKPCCIIPGKYSCEEFDIIKYWDVSEKIDGTNIRIIFKTDEQVKFRGKSDNSQIPGKLTDYLVDTFKYENIEEALPDCSQVILFGEGYGKGIQSFGKHYSSKQRFVLFDVLVGEWWLERYNVWNVAEKLGVPFVPYWGRLTIDEIVGLVKVKPTSSFADGNYSLEGFVARSSPLMLFRNKDPIMFKLKIKDYVQFERYNEQCMQKI